MVIKPNVGARVFSAVAGVLLIMMACLGLTVPFPGLLFTVLGIPLGVFAFGYAFGVAQTRVDVTGIFQRSFFFRSKQLEWGKIESGRIVEEEYRDQRSSAGWVEYRTRMVMEFKGDAAKIRINANNSGPENWWDEVRKLAKEKLGNKFEG